MNTNSATPSDQAHYRVFVSYAHEDAALKDQLLKGLSTYSSQLDHPVEFWTDEEITLGADWHQTIINELKQCNAGLLLLSPAFFRSTYINKNEVTTLLQRAKEEGVTLLPVMLGFVDFDLMPKQVLLDYQAFRPSPSALYIQDKLPYVSYHRIAQNQTTGALIETATTSLYHAQLWNKIKKALQGQRPKKAAPKQTDNPEPKELDGGMPEGQTHDGAQPLNELMAQPPACFEGIFMSHEALPRQVIGFRALSHFEDFYFEREHDKALEASMHGHAPLLIKGNPLAGKSRSVYQAFKTVQRTVFVPKKSKEHLAACAAFHYPPGSIVYLDDVDDYLRLDNEATLDLIKAVFSNSGLKLVATCRTGPELDFVRNNISDLAIKGEVWTALNKASILIEKVEKAELITISNKLNKDVPEEDMDGNIGCLFMDYEAMRQRYDELEAISGSLPATLLYACRILYVGLNYEADRNTYDELKVKEVCRRYLGEKFIKMADWEDAIDELEIEDYRRNFIELEFESGDDGLIKIEEAYLKESIQVIAHKLKDRRLRREIKELFDTEESRKRWGFFTDDIKLYTKKMRNCINYDEALRLYKQMGKYGLVANEYVFNILIHKARTWEKKLEMFNLMIACEVKPDQVSYNSLINKAPTWQLIQAFFNEFKAKIPQKEWTTERSQITFSTLIQKAPDWNTAQDIFKQMTQANIKKDEVTFNTLIQKAPDWNTAEQYLGLMIKSGCKPNEVTFNTLIQKAPDWNTAQDIFKQMTQANIKKDEVTFSTLIQKAPDWNTAEQYLGLMVKSGCKPDAHTYTIFIKQAKQHATPAQGQARWEAITGLGPLK